MSDGEVLLSDGRRIVVLFCPYPESALKLGIPFVPINTTPSSSVAYLSRGDHYHGSLDETVYLSGNLPQDATHMILWFGDNGSQTDDDQGRLYPHVWLDLSPLYDDDEKYIDIRDERHCTVAVMLFAWFRWTKASWGDDHYFTGEDQPTTKKRRARKSVHDGKLTDEYIATILRAAHAGEPLELPTV